jgi:hypothetical protein
VVRNNKKGSKKPVWKIWFFELKPAKTSTRKPEILAVIVADFSSVPELKNRKTDKAIKAKCRELLVKASKDHKSGQIKDSEIHFKNIGRNPNAYEVESGEAPRISLPEILKISKMHHDDQEGPDLRILEGKKSKKHPVKSPGSSSKRRKPKLSTRELAMAGSGG